MLTSSGLLCPLLLASPLLASPSAAAAEPTQLDAPPAASELWTASIFTTPGGFPSGIEAPPWMRRALSTR